MEDIKKKYPATSFDVAQLLKEPVGSSRSYDISGDIGGEVEGVIEGKAKLIRINGGVLVQCKLTAEMKLICSRCLAAFLWSVTFTAEEEFLPVSDVSGDLAISLPERLEQFTIDSRHILDLSELIRQYVLLNLPMKPLCRPDCPGMKETRSHGTTT